MRERLLDFIGVVGIASIVIALLILQVITAWMDA